MCAWEYFLVKDWNLPDLTGLDFLKKIRASKKYEKTPFVMCSTMNEMMDMINAVKEGANDYIVKPWQNKDIENKLVLTWNIISEDQ